MLKRFRRNYGLPVFKSTVISIQVQHWTRRFDIINCLNTTSLAVGSRWLDGHSWFQWNLSFLVVGQQEKNNGTINIRTRDNKQHGEFPIDEVIRRFKELAESRTNHAEDEFAGSSVDANVAGATSQLEASNLAETQPEQQQ